MNIVLDLLFLIAVPTGFITMILYFVNLRHFGKKLHDQFPEEWKRLKSEHAFQPALQLNYLALKETGTGKFKAAIIPADLMLLRRSALFQIKISILCLIIIIFTIFTT